MRVGGRIVIVVLGLGLAVAARTLAQDGAALLPAEQPVVPGVPVQQIARTPIAPVIDGVLEPEVWADAPVIEDFRQVEPDEGAEPTERTEVRLLYDDDFLYVGFRCYDRDPSAIIATQMKRDADLESDDRVAFLIDPIFDRRNAFFFEMNPVGAKVDALIENNRRFLREWDGIWYGRSTIDDEGWVVEIAIPFLTISFNPKTTRWSFNATRVIRRRNETLRWATPSRNVSFNSVASAGIIQEIEDITQGVGLDVAPWGLVRGRQDRVTDDEDVNLDGGVDAFYKLTPSTTLSVTINTDFAETEVDERRVNLTRFPLFFPEKREFFLQDAGIFNFGGINRNPLPFFSRRIGLDPDGQVAGIRAGVKVTGREESVNFGVLGVNMETDDELGHKNYLVGRASVNVLEQSAVGGIFTYGDASSPDDNLLGGLDFNYRTTTFDDDKTVQGSVWAQHSDSTDADGDQTSFGGRLEYPNDRVNWRVGYTHIGDAFNAGLGFVPRRGIREYFADWRYRWRPDSDLIRFVDAGAGLFLVTDMGNDVESRSLDLDLLTIESQDGDELSFSYELEREVLEDDFEIVDDVVIPVDDYRFDRYGARLSTSTGRPISGVLRYEGGEFFDGTREDYRLELEWRVSRHLFLGFEYERNDVDLDDGDFTVHVLRGRVNVDFTPDLSWSTFAQFDNQSDLLGINTRVRWIIEPGSELFFVVNQTIDREGSRYQGCRRGDDEAAGTFRF